MDNKTLIDKASVFRYHKYMIEKHGNESYRALGWRDINSQLNRFNILSQIDNLNERSVLDAGCGHADFRAYLGDIYPGIRYYGIEQIPEFLEFAIKKYAKWPETLFYQGDFYQAILPHVDYMLVSGSLNYRHSDPNYIYKVIKKLFEGSRLGLGFNLLSNAPENKIIVSHDPELIIKYCHTLCNNVVYRNDYSDEDFTIFLYHQAS
jgi:SAM-dependent methyltransferase